MNLYNQVPHLISNAIWESDKNNTTRKREEVSPFPAGDHKGAGNRQDSITLNINNKKISTKKEPSEANDQRVLCIVKHKTNTLFLVYHSWDSNIKLT